MFEKPLEGVTVLDFSQLTQGPLATQNLADMGADVIKVERPGVGELRRHTTTAGRDVGGEATSFLAVNRNKRGLTLNLKAEEGQEIGMDLVADADVFVHNFRPGVMERLGFGYEDVKDVNEEIIYVHSSGFGTSGPYVEQNKPGRDLLIQSMTGMAAINGRKDDPPIPIGTSAIDYHGGTLMAYGITLALFHRQRTGEGQRLDMNLFDSAIDMQIHELCTYLNTDIPLERSEEGISVWWNSAPYGLYETADGYLALSAVDPNDLEQIGDIVGVAGLGDYSTEEHFTKRDEIKRKIEAATRDQTTADLLEDLEAADIWCAPVRTYDELVEDPQVEHNDMIESVEHPDAGEIQMTGIPLDLSETPGDVESPPPRLGEHTDEILEELGYDTETIAKLRDDDVI